MKAISLGWGVQSWTLAAMSALGALPKVDMALHADTTHERSSTYEFAQTWTPWLQARGIQVETVVNDSKGGTDVVHDREEGKITIPAFTVRDGEKGTLRRQCTGDWKITPIRRHLQKIRGGATVELQMGITTDEWQRAKDADVKYIRHVFPLLELNMSRADCIEWLKAHDLPSPGKSSCVFCPYQNKRAWQEMKRQGGADWQKAVEVDESIRNVRLPGQLFVHSAAIPLVDAVVIPEDFGFSQGALFDLEDAECDSGYCFM